MVKGKHTAPTGDGMLGASTVVLTLAGLIQTAMRLGPVFNPAVAVAFYTLDAWQGSDKIYTHYTYAYILGPALGGIIAGLFYTMHEKAFDGKKADDEGEKAGIN